LLRRIEECAAEILAALRGVEEINLLRLREHVRDQSVIAYQALGWLAREGRIRYQQRDDQIYVSKAE
jgi:hypothetical protein